MDAFLCSLGLSFSSALQAWFEVAVFLGVLDRVAKNCSQVKLLLICKNKDPSISKSTH